MSSITSILHAHGSLPKTDVTLDLCSNVVTVVMHFRNGPINFSRYCYGPATAHNVYYIIINHLNSLREIEYSIRADYEALLSEIDAKCIA